MLASLSGLLLRSLLPHGDDHCRLAEGLSVFVLVGEEADRSKRAGTPPLNAVVRETIMERQVHCSVERLNNGPAFL